MSQAPDIVRVPIRDVYRPYVPSVLTRLGYLYPFLDFSVDEPPSELRCSRGGHAPTTPDLIREINYLLYRERIHSETLTIRKKIYGAR